MVLTGFRAFPGVADNPTAQLVGHLADQRELLPAASHLALLDVDYRTVGPAIDELLAMQPAALVLTGYSGRATGITLEAQATSRCAADQPDRADFVPAPSAGPPLATPVDLPRLHAALEAIAPCSVSQDAGQYLCNFAYRHALARAAERGLRAHVLFVHLPAITGTTLAQTAAASLPLEVMTAVLARICHELADGS